VTGVGESAAVASSASLRRPGRPGVLVLLVVAVAVQLVVLYAPDSGRTLLFPQADKVVHLLVFLVPTALAVVAGFRRRVVVGAFAAQAVLSEVVQALFLPHRSGDVLDAAADLTGVALGVLVGAMVLGARATRAEGGAKG